METCQAITKKAQTPQSQEQIWACYSGPRGNGRRICTLPAKYYAIHWGFCPGLQKLSLSDFLANKNLPLMVRMLVRSLSLELVEAALDGLSKNSAPGADGVQASIYSTFREFLVPLMHEIYQQILHNGQLNADWASALFNPKPKALGQVGVADLRPLVLQNCCQKWTSATLLLQLQTSSLLLRSPNKPAFSKADTYKTRFGMLLARGPR